jgi:endonuclease/exonuclease/phosphatase family metal-dependent hydrolase
VNTLLFVLTILFDCIPDWYTARMKKLLAFILSIVFVSVAQAQIRVVNYNVAKCIGDNEALDMVLDSASLDDSHGDALPVSIFLFQEVSQGNEKILHRLLGDKYSMGKYTNQGESGGAQAMFYDSTQFIELPESHEDIFTGATRYADRWELNGIGENKGITLWVYSMHLKASKGTENKEKRLFGATAILEDIAKLEEDAHVIVVGDMNFYSNKEPAYKAFVKVLEDPLGEGEWAGKDDAKKHTQSPLKVRKGGLIHGGLDDRFDFQFISKSLQDGSGLDLVRGSYHAMGNDGEHYDIAINDGDSIYFSKDLERSNELATALHDASDHIPVIADYEVVKQEKPESDPDTSN